MLATQELRTSASLFSGWSRKHFQMKLYRARSGCGRGRSLPRGAVSLAAASVWGASLLAIAFSSPGAGIIDTEQPLLSCCSRGVDERCLSRRYWLLAPHSVLFKDSILLQHKSGQWSQILKSSKRCRSISEHVSSHLASLTAGTATGRLPPRVYLLLCSVRLGRKSSVLGSS